MKAFFQSDGTSPWSSEYWYNLVRVGAIWSAALFRMKFGIQSGPAALCIFRSRISLWTPLHCTSVGSMAECGLGPFVGILELSFLV